MKQLMMILDHFPPAFAPRMGYLAKYLHDMDWDAVAISVPHPTRNTGFEFLAENIESHVIAEADYSHKTPAQKLFNELYGCSKLRPLWTRTDQLMYRKAKALATTRSFDAILCSTASFFPLYSATLLARETRLPLLIDLRDIYEQDDNLLSTNALSKLLHKRQIAKRNKLLAQANAVTTVSSWHKELLERYNSNTTLIFNGFDESLFSFPQPVETEKFTITYTGSIRVHKNPSQSPELLFDTLKQLIAKNLIDPNNIKVNFYSDCKTQLFINQLIKKNNLQTVVKLHPWTTTEKVPEILAQSNVLLLLLSGNNTRGILTTKLFEYMAANREILCIPNNGGEMDALLTQSNAGCCINTSAELCNYLKFKYNEWQKKRLVEPHTDRLFAENFSRERQAMQFVNILNNIIKTNNL